MSDREKYEKRHIKRQSEGGQRERETEKDREKQIHTERPRN